jgi:two-component system, sensor histidine kinase and response regulator
LVSIMDGQIGVQSEMGNCSIFWFTAKLEKQFDPVTPRDSRKIWGHRVLVVDDNDTNRQILMRQLRSWNMRPDSAASGIDALTMMRDAASNGKPYALALLDRKMPEMDGLALGLAIRNDPLISSTRSVLLTSHGQLLRPTELEQFGIDSCINKPVKRSRLVDRMTDALMRPPHSISSFSAEFALGAPPAPAKIKSFWQKIKSSISRVSEVKKV